MSIIEGGGASETTEPASGTSAATDVSLRTYFSARLEHVVALIDALDKRTEMRFADMKDTVDTAFREAQKAIDKAEAATERRLEGMNEFRDSLSDQASNFVSKETLQATVDKLEAAVERNRTDVSDLTSRVNIREGETTGSRMTWGSVAALIATFAAVFGVLVVVATYIGTH